MAQFLDKVDTHLKVERRLIEAWSGVTVDGETVVGFAAPKIQKAAKSNEKTPATQK